MSAPTSTPKLPVAVEKATPYTFDLGHLLAQDPNSIELDKSSLEQSLADDGDGTLPQRMLRLEIGGVVGVRIDMLGS